ncbi:hypothetical protein Lalb_Chr14g0363381 [Lupinus albus]|uniref:Uncharacterized protein n=1 Tax=Lupinus albus TaxID=3870 RepID=A0A6A4PEH1_LUPAL|nr:hypothetical protein Lalb_Chr14g0363381 [Lupinus albus]
MLVGPTFKIKDADVVYSYSICISTNHFSFLPLVLIVFYFSVFNVVCYLCPFLVSVPLLLV